MTKIPTEQELQEMLSRVEESKTGLWDLDYGFSMDIPVLVGAVRDLKMVVGALEKDLCLYKDECAKLEVELTEARQETDRLGNINTSSGRDFGRQGRTLNERNPD